MEFGKVTPADLNHIDFKLPPEGANTLLTLKGSSAAKPAFYVGCGKWGREEWKGLIYPPDTKAANFLDEYARQFNAIELNASFYKAPTPASIKSWRLKVEQHAKREFLFVPKFPRTITHIRKLQHAREMTEEFLTNIAGLGEHLGPCFLQLSDAFGPKAFPVLESYLRALPKDIQVFVELRSAGWYSDPVVKNETFNLFTELNIGTVITDTSGRRDLLDTDLTIPEAFIRFQGNGRDMLASDEERIMEWAIRIKLWVEMGLKAVYFFVHQLDEADTPALANVTIEVFNSQLDADLQKLTFILK